VKTFLDNNLLVCLNSDDPAVQGCDIKHEYQVAAVEAGLSDRQCRTLQDNALKMAFLSDSEKLILKNTSIKKRGKAL
jgi:adenosine deaminase